MSSSAPKRSHHQIQRDRQLIADWYCQGLTQAAIAERLNASREYNLSQQTISNDIRAIQSAWLASSLRDFDEMRSEQLGKIDRLEREYWRGWERSCEDAETIRNEGPKSGPEKIVKTSKGQAGSPAFLAGVERCIERRCKLFGLDAPKKVAPTTPDGKESYDPAASIKSEILGALSSIATASAENDDS